MHECKLSARFQQPSPSTPLKKTAICSEPFCLVRALFFCEDLYVAPLLTNLPTQDSFVDARPWRSAALLLSRMAVCTCLCRVFISLLTRAGASLWTQLSSATPLRQLPSPSLPGTWSGRICTEVCEHKLMKEHHAPNTSHHQHVSKPYSACAVEKAKCCRLSK